jgi:hypothetical protein
MDKANAAAGKDGSAQEKPYEQPRHSSLDRDRTEAEAAIKRANAAVAAAQKP